MPSGLDADSRPCSLQLFVIRHNTAQILEREQEEEKQKILSKNPELDRGGSDNNAPTNHPALPDLTPSQQAAAEESGIWKESESGLEWIALPNNKVSWPRVDCLAQEQGA